MDGHLWLMWSNYQDKSCKKVSQILINEKANNCYIFNNYYKPGLQFYFKTNQFIAKLNLADQASVDFSTAANASAFILTDKNKPCLFDHNKYQLIYDDKLVGLYKLK